MYHYPQRSTCQTTSMKVFMVAKTRQRNRRDSQIMYCLPRNHQSPSISMCLMVMASCTMEASTPEFCWSIPRKDIPSYGRCLSYSKFLEVVPMLQATIMNTIAVLRHVFSYFGLPEHLLTDNGTQFTSAEFKKFLEGNDIQVDVKGGS